jgi:hypothetical protein
LVKEFSRAVGASAPRQHGDRVNGESKVILASTHGILRHRIIPKRSDFHGGVHHLFQLGFHGGASTAFNHKINIHHFPNKMPFHKKGIPVFGTRPSICKRSTGFLTMPDNAGQ